MTSTNDTSARAHRLSRRILLRRGLGVIGALAAGGVWHGRRGADARASGTVAGARLVAAQANVPAPTAVMAWDGVVLEAIRRARLGPPMVARALAIIHTAMYDAWAAYHPVAAGTRLGGLLRRPKAEHTPANKTEAISYAAYRTAADLFPAQLALFDAQMAQLGYDAADARTTTRTPAGIGNLAAQAVLAFRHGDGSNQLGDLQPGAYADYTGYAPVNGPDHIADPNRWQPLRFSDGQGGFVAPGFIAPHWGLVTPFALRSGSQLRPPPPPRYPSEEYRRQAEQVLEDSANLTDEHKAIVEYWADGPNSELPPGHWCLFAALVSERDGHDLDADVQLLFALTNALLDASIAAWDAKRAYDSPRPITAIRFLFDGQPVRAWGGPYQGTRVIDGGTWRPYQPDTFLTPPFPEHVSGHSTFSAAAAEILARFTGRDAFGAYYTRPAGASAVEPGAAPPRDVTLRWDTFSEAAGQAGRSRRSGGIHFEAGDLAGREMGRRIAELVWDRAQSYITGAAGA